MNSMNKFSLETDYYYGNFNELPDRTQTKTLSPNKYPESFSKVNNQQQSVLIEPSPVYSYERIYINVDSRDRNVTSYPYTNRYRVNIEPRLKNVKEVQLISAVIPNQNSILDNGYVVLNIEELNNIKMTSPGLSSAFGILHLKSPTSSNFIISELGCHLNTPTVFKQPKDISSLTISIHKPSGELFTFGEASGSVLPQFQHSFLLSFKTEVSDISRLNSRNVY